MIRSVLFLSSLAMASIFAHEKFDPTTTEKSSDLIMQIVSEQPGSIERMQEDKLYLKTERIFPTSQGLFLYDNHSAIPLANIFSDHNGCYIARGDGYAWSYKCANEKCRFVWSPTQGSFCPICGSPGQLIH